MFKTQNMSDNTKKLFLLDAFALIYRAYFAFGKNHRYNSKGLNTSAMLGFTNTLIEVLEKQKPSHIAVVFDAPGATNRVDDFADYKAGREAMPEDIRTAIPYIKQILDAFNIPIYLKEGYESVVSGKLKNKNAAKIKEKKQFALIDLLILKHTNLDNVQVSELYNEIYLDASITFVLSCIVISSFFIKSSRFIYIK